MGKKHTIHLPNGKSYPVIVTEDDVSADNIRDFMASHPAVTVNVELAAGKQASLLLWGDVLKNSYITIE